MDVAGLRLQLTIALVALGLLGAACTPEGESRPARPSSTATPEASAGWLAGLPEGRPRTVPYLDGRTLVVIDHEIRLAHARVDLVATHRGVLVWDRRTGRVTAYRQRDGIASIVTARELRLAGLSRLSAA